MIRHVVRFSGGACSWATAKRVVERHGADGVVLLFADTKQEDEDLYRFLDEGAANVGAEIVKIADGRDVWQVFEDERMIGNSRFDPCSKILKRKLLDKWVKANAPEAVNHVGLDWTEVARLERFRLRMAPRKIEAYMTEPPYMSKEQMLDWQRAEGIEPCKIYAMGFPHNNCGGFCVKAGQAQFALLLRTMPERYAYHEEQEARLMALIPTKHTILRDRRGGVSAPLSLRQFRERIEKQADAFDNHDWGGCACGVPA